jgi:serine/threonine protein kinase
MSVVYLASKSNKTSVALKVIRSQYLDNQADRNRIEREISTLTNIKSKYVCQILDSDISEDYAWIATEFIDGPDLKTLVLEDGPFDENSWYELAKGLLEGLSAIHENKVVHRDIKPSNILISDSGPKIIDFGIAQTSEATSLTSTGLIAGSPAWLSPEQINGDKVTYSSDFFSAGAVLNFAVSGKSPWGDNTKITKDVIYNRILQKQPDLSSLNILQKSLVEKMMQKDPKARPSADQALNYLNDKWSQEAKLRKQIEEEQIQREKVEEQKRAEQIAKKRKKRQRLRRVILEPLLIRRKVVSITLASILLLISTGSFAYNSYSSKSGIFEFLNNSTTIQSDAPKNIIAQPKLETVAPSPPVAINSPTPDLSTKSSPTPSKQSETNTTTETRIEICRTITQFGENKQCFNESQFHEITVQDLYQDCPWYAFNSGCEIGSKVIMPINRDLVTLPCVSYGDTLVRTGSIGVTLGAGGIRKSDYCAEKSNGTLPYSLNGFMPLSFFNPKEVSTGFSSLPAFGVEIFDEYKIVKVKVKNTSTSKNVSTTPNIVGSNIDLNKTKICLTIYQHDKNDNSCYKEIPVVKQPDYSWHRGITPYSEDQYLFLYVPWKKSSINGCTRISYSVTGQSYLNGDLFFNNWVTGTMDRNSSEVATDKFCQKMGGFDYADPELNMPYFNVAAFDKSKSLPQNYEMILNYGDYKINYIYTWQKR